MVITGRYIFLHLPGPELLPPCISLLKWLSIKAVGNEGSTVGTKTGMQIHLVFIKVGYLTS